MTTTDHQAQAADGRVLLGMLTPSSNTVLEPVCAEMLRGLPEVSAHFSRFRVTSIALDDRSLGQFDQPAMLEAASLLADARVLWPGEVVIFDGRPLSCPWSPPTNGGWGC